MPEGDAYVATRQYIRRGSNGANIDPAEEATLQAVRDRVGAVDDAQAGETGNGSLNALLKRIRAILIEIRDDEEDEDWLEDIDDSIGDIEDAEAATGNGTVIALLKALRTYLTSLRDNVGDATTPEATTLIGRLAALIEHVEAIEAATGTTADPDTAFTVIGRLKQLVLQTTNATTLLTNWNANSRAKVSPIVGQDGVSAGVGGVDAGTQRVTLTTEQESILRQDAAFKAGTAAGAGVFITAFEAGSQGFFTISATTTGAWQDAAGQAGLVAVEGTNDPAGLTGWGALRMENPNGQTTTAMRGGGTFHGEVTTRWLRVNCLVFKAGTFVANLVVFPRPRQLFKHWIGDQDGIARVEVTPGTGRLHTISPTPLLGGNFDQEIDTDIWTVTATGSGIATRVDGLGVKLETGTTPNSTIRIQSNRVADIVPGLANVVNFFAATEAKAGVGNVTRWGAYDDDSGVFLEQYHDGTAGQLRLRTRKAGVDSTVTLNGTNNVGDNGFGVALFNLYEFQMDPAFVKFRQSSILGALASGQFPTLFSKFNLPLRMEIINSGGASTNKTLYVQYASIVRLGPPQTIRADQTFEDDHVLGAMAAVIQGRRVSAGRFDQVPLPEHFRDTGNEQTSSLTNGTPVTFTVDEPANTIESVAHGLTEAQPIWLTTDGTLPAPLSSATLYYVRNPTADDFQVATSRTGTPVNVTDTGTGTHSYKTAGEFTGTYRRISDVDHTEILYASSTDLGVVEKIWSDDGVTEQASAFSRSAIPNQEIISGPLTYNVYYDIGEGRNMGPFYKLHVVNGPDNQGPFPLFISITWLMKTPYQGAFTTKDAQLNNLSKFLLARVLSMGEQPDGDIVNARADGEAFITRTVLPAGGSVVAVTTHADSHVADTASGAFDTDGYNTIELGVFSDVEGSIFIEYVDDVDSTTPQFFTGPTLTYGPDDVGKLVNFPIDRSLDGFKATYTNNPTTGQANFLFAVQLRTTAVGPPKTALNAVIAEDDEVTLMRGAIIAPDGTGEHLTVGRDGDGPSINTHITNIDDGIVITAPPYGPQTRTFVLGSEAQRIDQPDVTSGLGRRFITVRNAGTFHIFTLEDDTVSELTGEPSFIGGESHWALPIGGQLWACCEDIGGSAQNVHVDGTTGSGTSANPGNAVTSDNIRAEMTAVGQTLKVVDFTFAHSPGFGAIERLRIGFEVRKNPNQFETVAYVADAEGATAGSGSVSTPSMAAGTAQLRLVAVSRNDNVGTVTGVSQGGVVFAPLHQNITSGNRRLDVWWAYGDFDAGPATATLLNSTNAHIAAEAFSDADPVSPIEDSDTLTGTGTTPTVPAMSKTAKGFAYMAISHTQANGTPGGTYIERSDQTNGAGSNTDSLATESRALATTGTEAPTYTITSGAWAAIGVTVRPRVSHNPVVRIGHEYNGTPSAFTEDIEIDAEADTVYYSNITQEFGTILPSDIALIDPTVIVQSIGAASVQPDNLFLEVRETSGATSRISVKQYGVVSAS